MPDEFDALAERLVPALLADARLKSLAQAVAGLMLDDPRFRLVVREVVLRTVLELEQQQANGPVREFLRACEARGVAVEWDYKAAVVICTPFERLGKELEMVLAARRAEISDFVKGRR